MSNTDAIGTDEQVRLWASDWADIYDQGMTTEKLSEWVGKTIRTHAVVNEEEKGFHGKVIGYSVDTLLLPDTDEDSEHDWHPAVNRYSFIIDQGLQCSIFAGMTIEEVEEE